jgi:ribonucleoside-triphosphate reductase (thioredoxin)
MKDKYLPTDYQTFIAISRYARWLEKENRREYWPETVGRYIDNVVNERLNLPDGISEELREAITNLEVMPSMRAMMTAGPALDRDNTAGYNCSYVTCDSPRAFDETLFILCCGTGVGFSVESQYIRKLPIVPEKFEHSDTTIVVKDSKEGWARAFRQLISLLYAGEIPKWDVSRVRPSGARLKTFGGRASGPAPLIDLFNFTIATFRAATDRKLNSLECHDIMCKIGDIVVVGGVRRSALISLSDLSDDKLRHAKSGQWWLTDGQRALANNSAVYNGRPDMESFLREWTALVESKSGERGIVNRTALIDQLKKCGRRDTDFLPGLNPCAEIILRPQQFCNLTEIVVRPEDTRETLLEKVRLATILGTIQSTLTDFPYLRKIWKKNTEQDRLLGVSITGACDNPSLITAELLQELKEYAIAINIEYAEYLGVEPSTMITAVKPSGTVSQLVNASSGLHTRFSPFGIRTVRGDKKDPLSQFLMSMGIPHEDDITKPDSTVVFSFPFKSPKGSLCTKDMTAIEQLEWWKMFHDNWTEHNPSVTIMVKDHEWMDVGAWVYRNFDSIGGISFLPYSEHSYQQAPYQEITEAEYEEALALMPKDIDWTRLVEFETEDTTNNVKTLACTGASCELVDISG